MALERLTGSRVFYPAAALYAALGLLFAPWLAARAAFLGFPGGLAAALCISAIGFHFVSYPLSAVVMLLAALMLLMGGRIIAPGVAGQLERQGLRLAARVQPRIEAGLAAIRLARWRLWALRGRPDLVCLASGYAWLALGLAAFDAAAEAAALCWSAAFALLVALFAVTRKANRARS